MDSKKSKRDNSYLYSTKRRKESRSRGNIKIKEETPTEAKEQIRILGQDPKGHHRDRVVKTRIMGGRMQSHEEYSSSKNPQRSKWNDQNEGLKQPDIEKFLSPKNQIPL
ncbi:hypothetical protein C922_03315 [Plasmodium inui San Antonio 1]|uniref:Uncharacterized protein n=1 Tax=Plasmodium inui San Antonio 1 TaxID=1237626 RepID=W7ABC5_9APIC|nr:hypothetical protein C922_03315 [Plasmodium inui San Antonio 1]EUD66399.1 hypothetical protein C922_03315 [Plasmodium inui San Antonio 1]